MLEMPALRMAFEQLCECFRRWASSCSAFRLFFLNAFKSFFHRDLALDCLAPAAAPPAEAAAEAAVDVEAAVEEDGVGEVNLAAAPPGALPPVRPQDSLEDIVWLGEPFVVFCGRFG